MPIAKLRSFVRALAGRRNVERDVSEEMHFHIERRSQDLISPGRSFRSGSAASGKNGVWLDGKVQGRGSAVPGTTDG